MVGRRRTDEATRFWEKVDRRGPDECWPWLAGTHKGYGTFGEKGAPRGIKAPAPAVAFRLTYGHKPEETDHLCCNPLCCNPAHLEDVTHSENMRRIWARKRAVSGICMGTFHGRSKLTRTQVEAIKKDTRPSRTVAKDYGVEKTAITRIRSGRTYKVDAVKVVRHL
jgi:hypothetical protein